MTNDDRSNEDRTGDGSAPVWGQAPRPDQHDAPRYGERTDHTSGGQYGQPAQYGQQPYGQQQHGEQDQYGRQDSPTWGEHQGSHQPYAASSAPASAGSPAWQSYEEPKRKKKTVGIVAFVVGLLSLVLGVIGGALMGAAFAGNPAFADFARDGGSSVEQQQQLQQQLLNDPNAMSQFGGGFLVIGIAAVLGLWALVQGIIAAVAGRGRLWGVLAIVLAVVATIATIVAVTAAAASAVTGGN